MTSGKHLISIFPEIHLYFTNAHKDCFYVYFRDTFLLHSRIHNQIYFSFLNRMGHSSLAPQIKP